jgi:hypothetical protein
MQVQSRLHSACSVQSSCIKDTVNKFSTVYILAINPHTVLFTSSLHVLSKLNPAHILKTYSTQFEYSSHTFSVQACLNEDPVWYSYQRLGFQSGLSCKVLHSNICILSHFSICCTCPSQLNSRLYNLAR